MRLKKYFKYKDEIVCSTANQDFSLLLINISYNEPKLNLYTADGL